MENALSQTEENYLKAVFSLSRKAGAGGVSTKAIAQMMETKAASVTDMMQRLNEKGFINYKKYQGVTLTKAGRQVAVSTVRKHRLWEVFLVEKLHFKWDEVHELAEQLEHIRSTDLTDRLDAFLGYPNFDPHGDPIPDKEGVFPTQTRNELAGYKTGQKVVVTGVRDTAPEFLQWLEKQNIRLGTHLQIENVMAFDRSMEVSFTEGHLSLSEVMTQNLLVKPLER